MRHIAEGANRILPRDKSARFMIARGEVGECEAALELARVVGLGSRQRIDELRVLADRVAAMLLGLIRRSPDLSLSLVTVLSRRLREVDSRLAARTRAKPDQVMKLYDKLEAGE